jgi:PAS domain S-box-containing protein
VDRAPFLIGSPATTAPGRERRWLRARAGRDTAAFVAGAVLVAALVVYLSVWLHRQSEATARVAAANVVMTVATHLDAMLGEIATVVGDTAASAEVRGIRAPGGEQERRAVASALARRVGRSTDVAHLAVLDAGGRVQQAAHRAGLPAPPDATWAAAVQGVAPDGLQFSNVVTLGDGRRVIFAVRALGGTGDLTQGYAAAAFDLTRLETILDALDLGPSGVTAVRRLEDGRMVARAPSLVAELNRASAISFLQAARDGVPNGTTFLRTPYDQLDKLATWRRLERYPFVVTIALAKKDYLTQWRQATWTAGALALIAIALAAAYLLAHGRESRMRAGLARQVAERERRFRAALSSMREGLFVLEGDPSNVTVANGAAARICGMPRGAIEGRPIFALPWRMLCEDGVTPMPKESLPSVRAVRTGEPVEAVMCLRRTDGTRVWVRAAAKVIAREASGPTVLITFSDFTDERHFLEALRRSEARLQSIIDTATDGIVCADAEHRVVLFNAAAERMFGYAAADIVGRPLVMLLPDEKRARHAAHVERYAANPDSSRMQSLVDAQRRDGSRFPVDISVATMVIDGERMFTAVVRDATARVEAEQALKAANASLDRRVRTRTMELEQANRELEAFSYSVSHDLRAPLRAMHAFTSLLRDHLAEAADAEARRLLSRILAGTERMGRLIDDVLRYSRITRVEITRVDVDVDGVVEEIAADLREAHPRTSIALHPLGHAQADAGMLRQILENLLGNACKYSDEAEAPAVHIGATREGERVEYWVRDNGIGFDMAHAGKLFGMFERLHTDARYPGTGVGLAVVKRLVERHDGRIFAHAEPGRGATFTFTLG